MMPLYHTRSCSAYNKATIRHLLLEIPACDYSSKKVTSSSEKLLYIREPVGGQGLLEDLELSTLYVSVCTCVWEGTH